MKQYVCISCERWQNVPSRTQHLMSRIKDAQVLFFQPPDDKSHKKPGRKVRPGLTIYTLPPAPPLAKYSPRIRQRGDRQMVRFVSDILERHRFYEPILWLTSPEQIIFVDYLAYRALVYDCDRDWPLFPQEESALTIAADVVFAASKGLVEHLNPCNDNIVLLPGGVNYPMFARESLEVPKLLADVKGPIAGYMGTLWRDLDLSPVVYTAQGHPECTFVFVGGCENNPYLPDLKRLPNVRMLGPQPLVDMPDYLARFDLCMNFYRRRDVGSDIVPSRLYEYLASGTPIVSLLWEDQVELFPDVIYGAHSPAEFSQLCTRALTEADDWAKNRRRKYAEAAAWSDRSSQVFQILNAIGLY